MIKLIYKSYSGFGNNYVKGDIITDEYQCAYLLTNFPQWFEDITPVVKKSKTKVVVSEELDMKEDQVSDDVED